MTARFSLSFPSPHLESAVDLNTLPQYGKYVSFLPHNGIPYVWSPPLFIFMWEGWNIHGVYSRMVKVCYENSTKKKNKINKTEQELYKKRKLRLCLVTDFCFLFSKICFWEYKEKIVLLYFWNQKHVWLVEIKKIFFWRKK